MCVQQDDAHAQSICEILDAFSSDDECDIQSEDYKEDSSKTQDGKDEQLVAEQSKLRMERARNLENTDELLAELSELEKVTFDSEATCQEDNNSKLKFTKTLGSSRKTRSQARTGNH